MLGPGGRKAALPGGTGGRASGPCLGPVLLITCLPQLSPWKIKPHREPGLSGLTLPSIYLFLKNISFIYCLFIWLLQVLAVAHQVFELHGSVGGLGASLVAHW